MGAMTTRESKVRMPWTQVWFQSDRERGLLHAFVKLKEMRMALADSDPDYFHWPFGRKCSNAFDRKEKRAKPNHFQFFPERTIDIFANVGKKTQSQMDLVAGGPAHTANARIESYQSFANRRRRID